MLDPKGGVPLFAVKRLEGPGALASIAMNEMQNGSGFAWVTPTSEVENVRQVASANNTDGDLASLLHNLIGFTKPEIKPEQWAEVRYPEDAFAATPLTPPTFLDGAPSIIYRSHRRNDGWGETVNLSNMGAGVPEAVHQGVPFTDKFEVMSVGWNGQLDAHVNWSKLLANMQHKWLPGDEALVVDLAGDQ